METAGHEIFIAVLVVFAGALGFLFISQKQQDKEGAVTQNMVINIESLVLELKQDMKDSKDDLKESFRNVNEKIDDLSREVHTRNRR